MTSQKFWSLTLYEWSLILLQVRSKQEMIISDRRFQMDMWGNYLAMYRNAHVDLEKEKPWTLKDVYPRPEEIAEKENEGYTQEEFLARAASVMAARERKKKLKEQKKKLTDGSNSTGTTGN